MAMRLATIVKINQSVLDLVSKYGLNSKDYKYIQLYYDFREMRNVKGEKYEYAINSLAEKYDISTSRVKRLIKKYGQQIEEEQI